MGAIQLGLENKVNSKKDNYIFYYNVYDREYDERGTIDTYESEVLGFKYDLSKTLNNQLSYGIGSEYKYDWGYFNNKGSYEASTRGHSDNFALYGNLGLETFLKIRIFLYLEDEMIINKQDQTILIN